MNLFIKKKKSSQKVGTIHVSPNVETRVHFFSHGPLFSDPHLLHFSPILDPDIIVTVTKQSTLNTRRPKKSTVHIKSIVRLIFTVY